MLQFPQVTLMSAITENEELPLSKDDAKGKSVKETRTRYPTASKKKHEVRLSSKEIADTSKENLDERNKQKLKTSESILKGKPLDMKRRTPEESAGYEEQVQMVLQKLKTRQKTDPGAENQEQKSLKPNHKSYRKWLRPRWFPETLRNSIPHDQRSKVTKRNQRN
nr:unnamed protein product [Callosobruchus analis]